jgi:L-lysine exporter family protein LysE/ArgO
MPFVRGLGMTASMIIALGPQNAYLLKYGLSRRRAVFTIAALYVLIDACLITLGALGVGTLVSSMPVLKTIVSVFAIAFFLIYGLKSISGALKGAEAPQIEAANSKVSYLTAILVSVANPAVLLDTIVIIGGMAAQYEILSDRITFSLGAATASLVWFATLSITAFSAGRLVTGKRVWQALDFAIGLLMLTLAAAILRSTWSDLSDLVSAAWSWIS